MYDVGVKFEEFLVNQINTQKKVKEWFSYVLQFPIYQAIHVKDYRKKADIVLLDENNNSIAIGIKVTKFWNHHLTFGSWNETSDLFRQLQDVLKVGSYPDPRFILRLLHNTFIKNPKDEYKVNYHIVFELENQHMRITNAKMLTMFWNGKVKLNAKSMSLYDINQQVYVKYSFRRKKMKRILESKLKPCVKYNFNLFKIPQEITYFLEGDGRCWKR